MGIQAGSCRSHQSTGGFGLIVSPSTLAFLWPIAKKLLPILLTWIAAAQRQRLISEGERQLLAKQLLAFSQEINIWHDIQANTTQLSPAARRDILTGRVLGDVEQGKTEPPNPE